MRVGGDPVWVWEDRGEREGVGGEPFWEREESCGQNLEWALVDESPLS